MFVPFDLLYSFHPSPSQPLATSNVFSVAVSWVWWWWLFKFYLQVTVYSICLSMSDLFQLAFCPQGGSSILSTMAKFPSFYGWIIFHCMYTSSLFILSEKAMATHSGTLAWKVLWTEEPGGLQSMGSLESDTTEWLHFDFPLSCIGEGNGNPLQCSCLENPRDGGAWWAAISGVAQSRTRLKRLSVHSLSMNT